MMGLNMACQWSEALRHRFNTRKRQVRARSGAYHGNQHQNGSGKASLGGHEALAHQGVFIVAINVGVAVGRGQHIADNGGGILPEGVRHTKVLLDVGASEVG